MPRWRLASTLDISATMLKSCRPIPLQPSLSRSGHEFFQTGRIPTISWAFERHYREGVHNLGGTRIEKSIESTLRVLECRAVVAATVHSQPVDAVVGHR